MKKSRCNICAAKSNAEICEKCGANVASPMSERLVLASKRVTSMDIKSSGYNLSASCKVALTNRRVVIYKIKPEAFDPAFSLFKAAANGLKKSPFISIDLGDIEFVRRYDKRHLIKTNNAEYNLALTDFREWDKVLTKYKKADER